MTADSLSHGSNLFEGIGPRVKTCFHQQCARIFTAKARMARIVGRDFGSNGCNSAFEPAIQVLVVADTAL